MKVLRCLHYSYIIGTEEYQSDDPLDKVIIIGEDNYLEEVDRY